MATYSVLRIGLSIAALIFGIAVLVFAGGLIRYEVQDDFYLLAEHYNPNASPADHTKGTYKDLYGWTEELIRQRNHHLLAFHYTLGISCIVTGLLLIAWTIDRERLRRKAKIVA